MSGIIEIKNLSYSIKGKNILKNVNLVIEKGESCALIGVNGSGKSTLLGLILNDIKSVEGEIIIDGQSPRNFKNWGVLYDFPCLYEDLTVDETIRMFSALNNVKYQYVVDKFYKKFEINSIKKNLVRELSAGEKRRVSILLAIIRPVDVLILDEPFSNLDPIMVENIWTVIKEQKKTILFSSHDWVGVEVMASKFVFLYEGEVLGNPISIRDVLKILPSSKILSFSKECMFDELNSYEKYISGDMVYIFYDMKDCNVDILQLINEKNINFNVRKADIRDVYQYMIYKKRIK